MNARSHCQPELQDRLAQMDAATGLAKECLECATYLHAMQDEGLSTIERQAMETLYSAAAEITRLRAQVASAIEGERERCARVAEEYPTNDYAIGMAVRGIAAAIREGG